MDNSRGKIDRGQSGRYRASLSKFERDQKGEFVRSLFLKPPSPYIGRRNEDEGTTPSSVFSQLRENSSVSF